MEVVNVEDGRYEQRDNIPGSSADSDASSSVFESNESSELMSDIDKGSEDDDEDLKEDLQKNIPECYKSDSNFTSHTSSDITNDEEFQATALCQFMDILNDLDEVLDKSLLACLDDGTTSFDSDEEDLICKIKEVIGDSDPRSLGSESQSSIDDNTQVVARQNAQPSAPPLEVEITHTIPSRPTVSSLRRAKSFSEITDSQRQSLVSPLERAGTMNDNLRNSMRRLDPIVLPAITTQESACEPLTLPVILFLEHHVNMRPTSAPIQLQVTAANLSSDGASGPLIVGRRALLMNRTLSLPSPDESDMTAGDWTGRNTARSTARSTSASSSSSESLAGSAPANQNAFANEERNEETEEPPFGVWPHKLSAMLACLSCTVGIFNISRFAIFSVHFGASFIIQFFILSFLIGIPLFTLHLCLGQVLEAGPVDMWRISPIFQGVGIALLIIQAVIGMYSIIGLSWIFVFFRDSFINPDDKYKWALPHEFSFEDASLKSNITKIQETIPQYFHGEVLQRNLGSNNYFGTIKFQVAFNLAVVWMIVFVALSKGLRSYGKAVYTLIFLPICGILVLCIKLLTLISYDSVTNIFSETEWSEFFLNSNSWAAAAQETFLTWGLFGACVMQLASHKYAKAKTNAMLQKESACIVAFTFAVLLLSSFLANTCIQILKKYGYTYVPGSFESIQSSQFLWPTSEPPPGAAVSTPVRYMGHYGSLVGVTVWKSPTAARTYSCWQPLQLATQIVPATLAVLPANLLSPAWAVIFFFILIMFGIAQQLAIWHCVIAGVMAINADALRVWETTITFLSCVFGLAMGLLLSTDAGIRIVHFIDYVWVGSWWSCAVQIAMALGVFAVRGRPYSPDALVGALYSTQSKASAVIAALLSFTWTVVLPVTLCAICVMDFRVGLQRQLYSWSYNWKKPGGYFPIWMRQVAVVMQQGTLLVIPMAAFVQTWRYMSKGPPDILERIQNLYRPRMGVASESAPPRAAPPAPPREAAPAEPVAPDPPPKYTPPPSYSTATGARLLNTIRRSFRTLRRITSNTRPEPSDDQSQIPITLSESVERERHISTESEPPLYAGVFAPALSIADETDSRQRPTSSRNSLSLTRDYLRRSFVRKSDSAKSIRSSLRRSFKYGGALTTSHEQLVRDVEPISNTVAMSAMLVDDPRQTRSLASVI